MITVRAATAGETHRIRCSILLCAGIILIVASLSVLLGWSYNIAVLKSILPHVTPMNPMSALSFMTLGMCFMAFGIRSTPPRLVKTLTLLSSGLMIIIGGLMIIHYSTNLDAHVDRLLFTSKLSINRVAPSTAICFFLTGWSLFLSQFYRSNKNLIRGLAFIVVFIAVYTLIGYVYGVQPVYGVALLNPMALNTAALFIIGALVIISLTVDRFVLYITTSLIAIYVLAIGIFMALSVYSFRTFSRLNNNNVLVQQNYQQQNEIDSLRIALVDAETGQRGYILTGDPAYLAPYNSALTREQAEINHIAQLPPSIISQSDVSKLITLTGLKSAELKQTINVRANQGAPAAILIVAQGQGKTYMDQIRTLLAAGEHNLKRQITANSARASRQNDKALFLLAISTASILALLLASLYFLQSSLKHQQNATENAEADRETTLEVNHHLESEASVRLIELEAVRASLETEVAKRTDELKTELERTKQLNSFMIDRELRIKALKEEIETLKAKRDR